MCDEAGRAAFSGLLALLSVRIATTTEPGYVNFLAVVTLGSLLILKQAYDGF